jgi:hypothetical protein
MVGRASAIMAAAACAALIVVLMPGFAPQVAAHAAQPAFTQPAATAAHPPAAGHGRKIACRESWPYYEPACLRDNRQPDGRARVVRVISIERASFAEAGAVAR